MFILQVKTDMQPSFVVPIFAASNVLRRVIESPMVQPSQAPSSPGFLERVLNFFTSPLPRTNGIFIPGYIPGIHPDST